MQNPFRVYVVKPGREAQAQESAEVAASQAAQSAEIDRQRAEYLELEEHEKGIRTGFKSWIKIGRNLSPIHTKQLYLRRSFASFEDYVEATWPITARQAWAYVRAAGVADNLEALGVGHALSMNAALKLAKLKTAEEQAACLTAAIAGSGTKSPSAGYLADAVAARQGKRPRKTRSKKEKRVQRFLLTSGTLTIRLKRVGTDLRALLEEALTQLTTPQLS